MLGFSIGCITSLYQIVVSLMDDSDLSSIDKASGIFDPDPRDPRLCVLYFSPEGKVSKLYTLLNYLDSIPDVYVKSVSHVSDSFIIGDVEGSENSHE